MMCSCSCQLDPSILHYYSFRFFGESIFFPDARGLSLFSACFSHTTHIQRWRDHAVAIPCSALRAELFAFAWRKSWTDRPNCSNHGNFPQEVRASTGRERGPRLLLLFSFLMIEVFFFAILNGLWIVFLLLFFFFNNYDRHWKSGICVHFPQS